MMLSTPPGRTPLDQLRSLLDKADARLGALETSTTAQALDLLRMLDEIETLYTDLQAAGVDLRAEANRRGTIQLTLQRKAGTMLRLLRPQGGLPALRTRYRSAKTRWWWYLDDYLAEKRRRDLRSTLIGITVIVAIIAVAVLLYRTVFAPDPRVVAHLGYLQEAQNAVQAGDLEGALRKLDQGLQEFPNDGEMLLWRGTVLHQLQRSQEAQADWEAARQSYDDEVTYLVTRANIRFQAGDVDGALADGQQAIKVDPDSPQAYLVVGGAQEVKGQTQAALQSYSKAAELAAAQKNTQLEAIAKIRMATLMQMAPLPLPSPSPTK